MCWKGHVEVSVFFKNSIKLCIAVVVVVVVVDFVCISVDDFDVFIRLKYIEIVLWIGNFNCINERPRLHFHHYFSYVVLWNSPNWNPT